MAVRLTCRYKSNMAVRYGIEIHDKDLLVDSTDTFTCTSVGAQSSYNNGEIDIFNPIVTSECTFSMRIETAEHNSFFTDYIGSAEGRFLIRLFYMDGEIERTYHIGRVTHDRAVLQKKQTPILTINTVDPLMELESIEYVTFEGIDYIAGTTQVLDWEYSSYNDVLIRYILNRSDTINYFFPNSADLLLEVMNEYKSTEHADPDDMISNTYMLNYFRENTNGQLVRKKCIYVLAEVLRSLGARIYYDRDRYFIEQLGAKNNTTIESTFYQVDGTLIGTSSAAFHLQYDLDYATSPMQASLYPEYTFLAPLNSVVLEQNGDYKENLLFDIEFDATTPALPTVVGSVSDLDQDLRAYCRINFRSWREKRDDNGNLVDYNDAWAHYLYSKISISIQVGDKYLSGIGSLGANSESNVLDIQFTTWSSNSNSRVLAFLPSYYMYADFQQNANDMSTIIDIISPNIVSVGDVVFGIENVGLTDAERNFYKHPGKITPPFPLIFNFSGDSNSLAILKNVEDAEDEKGSVITTLINDLQNTMIYNVRYDMGSFPATTSKHKLKVWNGTELVDSNEWVHPNYGNMPYQQLAIHDILLLRSTAKYRLHQVMRMLGQYPISMRTRLMLDGLVLVPLHMSLSTQADVTETLWVEVVKQAVASPPIDIELPTGETGLYGSGGITTNLQGQNAVSSSSGYYKLVESISGDNVILDDYEEFPVVSLYTDRSVGASFQVYIGGAKQRYRNVSKESLNTGEYRIDSDNRILEWKRDLTGRVAEVYVEDKLVFSEPSS